MSQTLTAPAYADLKDPVFLRQVHVLRQPDNHTNWFYLAREYVYLILVLGFVVAFYACRDAWGLSWAWNVPVTFLAVLLVGVGQHRLIMLGHEGSHYILFRNRRLNELASDWFCMFPLLSVTHNYRLQHLAHHQFVNDEARDPDLGFMKAVGHCYRVALPRWPFVRRCVARRFLWVPGLVRYIRVRAQHTAAGGGSGPYQGKGKRSRFLVTVGIVYILSLVGVLTALAYLASPWLLAAVPAAMLAAVLTFYLLAPERLYPHSLVRPDVPPRWYTLLRMTHLTLLLSAVAWLSYLTDRPWGLYFVVLWVVPLLTVFPFLMILREDVQHGDAGRGRFDHTRLFHGNPLFHWAVFPMGMDLHLPHHLFPMVPHYRLRALHELLMHVDTYRSQVAVAEGYVWPRRASA
jgi:fatty acid desaturase